MNSKSPETSPGRGTKKALSEKVKSAPKKTGVYIFKGEKDSVLYIGKAKDLRVRLRSYFRNSANLEPRKMAMVRRSRDFSYIVTDNELEALILEASLIKQHKPDFNIILRDDKNYPYIKLTVAEEWPRIETVRTVKKDRNLFFGPYIPAQAMREALSFIRKNFTIRSCAYSLDKPLRPCIQYQMKKCPAPCAGLVSREDYLNVVEEVRLFLSGEKKELINSLEKKMTQLSEEMKYEEAAKVRDGIFNLKRAFESQKVVSPELGDMDIIGCYREEESVSINILFLRKGVLVGSKDFFLEKLITSKESEIIHSVIEFFYDKDIIPPERILVNSLPEDRKAMSKWLGGKRGGRVEIESPKSGKKFDLLKMSNENARLHFAARKKDAGDGVLKALKEKLGMDKAPSTIGAFDVSTIHGSDSVGAFVFWEQGKFKKDLYRHLKIKGVQGIDDCSMIKEIAGRTLGKDAIVPDLVIIDGGEGQLKAAKTAMDELGINACVIGVAKKPDRAFLPDGGIIDLEDGSKPSLLLKRIRDEAHRFAVDFHRKLRDKRLTESPLEKIPGIAKKRRLDLLRHFGSLDNIRHASVDDIMKIKGFKKKTAEKIFESLKKEAS